MKDPCNTCHGSGKVRKTKKYEVNVPKGIDNGQTIRLAGKGEIGENGGGYGDLLVTVYVQPNRVFVRKGYDIYCDVPITFVQAALGGEITIKTIDGEEKYTVKPGTPARYSCNPARRGCAESEKSEGKREPDCNAEGENPYGFERETEGFAASVLWGGT